MSDTITLTHYKTIASEHFSGEELKLIHSLLDGAYTLGEVDGIKQSRKVVSEIDQMSKINERLLGK